MTRVPLLVLAALGLTAPARAAEPDPLLPADADTVVLVNVRQVLDSGLVKKYAAEQLKQVLDGRDLKELLTDAGLDPLKDIDTVAVGAVDASRDGAKFLAVARGTFDPRKILTTAAAKAKEYPDRVSLQKEGGATVLRLESEGIPPVFAAVLDGKTAVVANEKKLVTAAVAAHAAGKPSAVRKELAQFLRDGDDKASVRAVALLKGKFDGVTLPESVLAVKLGAFEKLLPKLEAASVGVRVGADVAVAATLRMADEAAATDMRAAIEELLKQAKPLTQLAGLTDPRYKPLTDILGTVKVASKGTDVTVTGAVTGEQIGKMLNPEG